MLDDRAAATLALTSRLVDSTVTPLSAREFWQLSNVADPASLLGKPAGDIASEFSLGADEAERIATLLDRGTALAIALERLDHAGIWTITDGDERYPARLRKRLGDAAPVALHGVGDTSTLNDDGVGVVGSRTVSQEGSAVARELGNAVAQLGLPVVAGGVHGVDQSAMNGAFEAGGRVLGVLADSLEGAVGRRAARHGIAAGRISLVTPYPPTAAFSDGNAMGRSKIIYALSRCTVVVASQEGAGVTWTGATEALEHGYGRVASWTGAGAGAGNGELVRLGAVELNGVTLLGDMLAGAPGAPTVSDDGQQLSLDL